MHVYAQVCGLTAGCFAAAGALPVAGAPACYLLAHSALQVTTCLAHLCVCSGAGLSALKLALSCAAILTTQAAAVGPQLVT